MNVAVTRIPPPHEPMPCFGSQQRGNCRYKKKNKQTKEDTELYNFPVRYCTQDNKKVAIVFFDHLTMEMAFVVKKVVEIQKF